MKTIVCTLFEGHFNLGAAALINSLLKNNFRGEIILGYKGEIPAWNQLTKSNRSNLAIDTSSFKLNGVRIQFIKLETEYHLTNYKPYFMIEICRTYNDSIDSIFYFDPDIVVNCNWSFFESWVKYGVAMVHEIADHDFPPSHPRRQRWNEEILHPNGLSSINSFNSYFNAGFIGLNRSSLSFLERWKNLMEFAIVNLGFDVKRMSQSKLPTDLFGMGDQDLLNITAMSISLPICEFGPEGMGFLPGGWLMFHGVGSPKPWEKIYILQAIQGFGVSRVDKKFIEFTRSPIQIWSYSKYWRKKYALLLASFISRFYARR
jgi:hypothetical protein